LGCEVALQQPKQHFRKSSIGRAAQLHVPPLATVAVATEQQQHRRQQQQQQRRRRQSSGLECHCACFNGSALDRCKSLR
jgi:hypothetical protein